jgi:hypothetical protein
MAVKREDKGSPDRIGWLEAARKSFQAWFANL